MTFKKIPHSLVFFLTFSHDILSKPNDKLRQFFPKLDTSMPMQLVFFFFFFQIGHSLIIKASKYGTSSCNQIFLVKTFKIRTTMSTLLNRMEKFALIVKIKY